ncbi:MAG TPA: DUF4331 domain-containing protein [Myxococcota bacterium]|nr:DUF4331 domain-containing protein [Myxococcota bacterium]
MLTAILFAALPNALASSHREAPAISRDPSADITDFYMFRNPNDSSKVVFIMNVLPLQAPYSGPNFHNFDDDVLYEIHIDNEGDGQEDISFQFQTTTTYNIPDTFLYNDGVAFGVGNGGVQGVDGIEDVNIAQTYTLTRVDDGQSTVIGQGDVAPANVGARSMIVGGYDPTDSAGGIITTTHTYNATVGGVDYSYFAGPRQEEFYVDLAHTFDLLGVAVTTNSNSLYGFNVHSIAIEVDADSLTRDGLAPSSTRQNEVIAAWSTTSRRALTVRRADASHKDRGEWVQVSRLGMPLVNEAVLPISEKDKFNASHPSDDLQFLSWVVEPLLPIYMNAVLGTPDANTLEQDADAALDLTNIGLEAALVGREDLAVTFLTGFSLFCTMPGGYSFGGPISGENKNFSAFEALRINLNGCPAWTSFGLGEFPNGRYLSDDVVDVELTALAGYLVGSYGSLVSDGVGNSGLTVLDDFPFMGDPWPGAEY